MKVDIVGAGPAGLYLAILLRKNDPVHEVRVLERNAPDATFGWGVVFSEETLGELRDADHPTYLAITDSFARWSTVDIRYRDTLLRSRGHTFSAIARRQLLAILQRRACDLGADLRFGVEAHAADLGGADLVVAADGANSLTRRAHADAFGTRVSPQGGKYVWFGTDLVLDAFRFIFTETEYGLIQVHSYPFDERTSTFIVECPEPTWRRAGLDRMSERESIEFCTELFADDLGGHRLMSNKSVWLDFPLVRNDSWHHGNVVLLGDAAHTAHFSIGSGTKLAMEDALALANALTRHDNAVPAALVDYELQRQPVVERFQQAAGQSAAYFGRVAGYTDLVPERFAFNLLTRSGRVGYANLTQRDPDLVRLVDVSFRGDGLAASPPMSAAFTLGELTVPNRVVAELPAGSTVDGLANAAGAGLVLTGLVAVRPDGRTDPTCHTLDTDDAAEPWAELAHAVHERGGRVALRLGHAGARGSVRPPAHGVDLPLRAGGWPLVAASARPYLPGGAVPTALDDAGMDAICADFAAAARRAAVAGVDLLELDAAHGYLLAGFLSPLTNRRTDRFGGADLANRMRFPLAVLAAVRAVWPGPLAVRLTVTDAAKRGSTVEVGIETAAAFAAAGAELVHVQAGQSVPDGRPEYRRGHLTELSDRVRNEARVPTVVGGYLTTTDEVNTIVAAGRADLCVLARSAAQARAAVFG